MKNNKIYKNLILKHGINPDNYHYSKYATHIGKGYNEFCGDQINLYVIKNKKCIKNISFLGKSCAISTASTSLMVKLIKGKNIRDIKKFFFIFSNMFIDNNINISFAKRYLDLENLSYVKQYPSRIKCVTLPWNILYNIVIKENLENNS